MGKVDLKCVHLCLCLRVTSMDREVEDHNIQHTGVAQLVEQWSPKPKVVSSNLTTRA